MSRVFAISLRELSDASPSLLEPGELIVSDECAVEILKLVADDLILWGHEHGKLVHPDD